MTLQDWSPEALPPEKGWVLYDGQCGMCQQVAAWLRPLTQPKGFGWIPIQDPWAQAAAHESLTAMQSGIRYLTSTRQVFIGYDAVQQVLLKMPGGEVLGLILGLPVIYQLGSAIYGLVAKNRHAISCVLRRS